MFGSKTPLIVASAVLLLAVMARGPSPVTAAVPPAYGTAPGGDWVQQSPLHAPPAGSGAAVAPDSSGRLILFGGTDGSNASSDTWAWDGTDGA